MNKFLKGLMLGLVSIVLLATAFATYKAESQNTNQRIFDGIMVTSGGTSGGELIAWLNTGGNNYIKGYLPRASVDTGWNNTGSDTIIPSEKLVWSLVSGLNNNYIPYWNGDRLYNSNLFMSGGILSGFGNYFPLAGNSISNPITGPLFIGDSTGSYNVEMGTTMLNFGAMVPVFGPIITPNAYVPGLGIFPANITKGANFFLGEEDEDIMMFLSSHDGTYATKLNSHNDCPQFELMLTSGNLTDSIAKWHFDADGTLKANYDISSVISADEDFITKKYADDNFFPGTNIDTGFNNTGSDTIIPSEKAIYNYIYQNNIRSRIGTELKTIYTGELNFQVGALTYATGGNAIAMGYNAKANKYGAIAIGNECIVNHNFGIAMGYLATASGESSVSMGFNTQTNAPYSVAMGDGTVASGQASVSFGSSTITNADHSMAIGKYNLGLTGSIFEIGFGYNEFDRSNLFTILKNGNVGILTHTPTQALTVSGSMGFDNGTDVPFRFAYSGGLMEGQYFTGGVRVSAVVYNLP